jgi:hypothetical protein
MRTLGLAAVAFALLVNVASAADHAVWSSLLERFVDDEGRVDYKRWKADAAAVKQLDEVIEGFASFDEGAPREKKLALFVNAYNAITVRAIVEFHPIASIKDKVSILGFNVWKDYKRNVAGKERSLDQIEHEVLRKLGDPRIHFAIVCASIGCPVLRREAYEPEKIDAQLEDQVQRFLADPTKFKVDGNTAKLSKLLDWFGEDFGGTNEKKLAWLAKHVKDAETKKKLESGKLEVEYFDYDWGLNEKK